MLEQQPFIDLQHHGINSASSNMDRALYKDLVDLIPLVHSLIERKGKGSFTRRGSMIYTKTPSMESLSRKSWLCMLSNGSKAVKEECSSVHPVRKKKDQDGDSYSIFSAAEKENEELVALREKIGDLQRKLLEKDELLKLAEISKNQIDDVHAELDKLKQHVAEKDALVNSIQLHLCDTKIKLADKQAALEKTQWEEMTSKQKVEKLKNDIDSMQGEFSSFMLLLNVLTRNNPATCAEDYDVAPYHLDHFPSLDDLDDKEMQKMEEARQAYVAALAAAKEKQDEESLAATASARLYLQSFLFRSEGVKKSNISIS
ncbi:hypothetical protein PTKIN_Ptkin05aG0183800 [Pterospermum kingtungense]